MPRRYLKVLYAAVLLGGCSQMPNYVRPAAPIPSQLPVKTTEETIRQVNENYFPDPRLQALVTVALNNNRDLRIATARILEARAQYGIVAADRYPTINLNAGRNASLTPASVSPTGNTYESQRYDVNANFISYELDFWGRVSSLTASAKANYLATESAQHAFRLSLISEVANAYLLTLELDERVKLTAESLKTTSESRQMAQRRREVGLSGELEYLQADAAYQSALQDYANLELQQAASQNQLSLLLGVPISEINDLPLGLPLQDQNIIPLQMSNLSSSVLLQRPDVVGAEQKLMAANANIGVARAAYFPRISLTSSVGTASRNLGGLFDANSGAWSFQPTLSLPIFDAGRNTANVNLAVARKDIAIAEYEKVIQQAFREVADLLSARAKLKEQQEAQHANMTLQGQRLHLIEARYKAGIGSYGDVLDAERGLIGAQQNSLQIQHLIFSNATQLFKALAGDTASDEKK